MSIMRIRTVISGLQGLPGLSTLYANGASATPVSADAVDMVARVRAFWNAIGAQLPSPVFTLTSGEVDLLDPANGALVGSLSVTGPASTAGTDTEALPLATAILLVGETGVILSGRRLRGRTFISPAGQTTNVDGVVTSATRTAIQTAANVMRTGTTASAPVVWHRPKLPGPLGGSVSPVTTYVVRSNYAVLRSRRD